jgi:phospholipid/cholesterol/gamma-HCH transport system substrate-binding protein
VKTETRVGIFVISSVLVFLYLSFNIGALRIDQKNYDTYISFFDDTGGLDLKALVKTSGVRVGWVEAIHLREGGKAEVHLKINKAYKLALNAYAMIQQETLLGGKIVELDQGDFSTGTLSPGTTLAMPGKSTTNVGDLIDQCRDIAQNVSDVAYSFKTVFSSREGRQQLEGTLRHVSEASENVASISDSLDRIVTKKETVIASAIDNVEATARELRVAVPKITHVVTDSAPTITAVKEASDKVRDGFSEAEQVLSKINTGKGVVGKLINEDETYDDLRRTIHGIKEYVHRMQSLQIYVDMHSESLFKYGRNKGFMDIKIRPSHDYFYQIQVCADDFGTFDRQVEQVVRRDSYGDELKTNGLEDMRHRLKYADTVERVVRQKNTYTFGVQFGKRFDRLALRIGLIEGLIGAAADYYVPLNTDMVHWITSLEVFDMQGIKRLNDNRPHLKWINKLMVMRNLYTCFGIDDIISRENASPFWGIGLRFTDADLKYFLSMLAGIGSTGK